MISSELNWPDLVAHCIARGLVHRPLVAVVRPEKSQVKVMERGICDFIRGFAAAHETFTINDLQPPLTYPQASQGCCMLALRGQIKVVSPGKPGPGCPTVYAKMP